ncbi:hypothetical protein DmGdi_09180 [Gluconobacter sp. Gdi]|nr:hypothetical protein DmGdi_09180 [Gluconobacter sp. Gdi]
MIHLTKVPSLHYLFRTGCMDNPHVLWEAHNHFSQKHQKNRVKLDLLPDSPHIAELDFQAPIGATAIRRPLPCP